MRLIRAELGNFGSYDHLEFTFTNQGLALVQGPTGSGKSTLFDSAAWILYGITAKDGSVDDVRSWNDSSLPTIGVLTLESKGEELIITRIRGKSNENDLYFTKKGDDTEHRGTNIKETQVLLDTLLGVDGSTYLAAAYFCEYSPSSTFFVSNATQRRVLFDRVSNLTFPTALAAKLSDKISESKRVLLKSQNDIASLKRQLTLIENNLKDSNTRSADWEMNFSNKDQVLQDKSVSFDDVTDHRLLTLAGKINDFDQNKTITIKEIELHLVHVEERLNNNHSKECPTCGQDITGLSELLSERKLLKARLSNESKAANPYTYEFEQIKSSKNTFDDQLKEHRKQVNPFEDQIHHFQYQYQSIRANLQDEEAEYIKLKATVEKYEHLKDLTNELKERLLTRSVKNIEELTNSHLTKHFNGELSVNLSISGPNALEIVIFKNGHEAVYKQLSKGQRQLLKISFSVAVMSTVADRSGIHFSTLFFDEALDGLDTELKVKAFSLFQSLEINHESIFVIDHAEEFKQLFSKRYLVSINADVSTLTDEQP